MTDALDRLKAALSDRYTIERELGRGGMATVYLAEDLKHHRKVAVKVLRPELAAALGAERFHQEIEIAAQLTHPHILPLHDSGDADGFLFYVMPYIEGESLRDKLAHEGELPIAEAVRILRDVVDALSHAHKHNVVHRDIKPDNIMLSDRHALVTDFGVAKAVSEATGRQQLTTEGVALGTPTYMAPEQAAADPHIDHRADIYAVGAVAYELLTGRPPFLGTTPQMILSAHMTDTPEPVTKYREAVPPALEQLVLKCLEKKAADRWQSAEELLPLLEAMATPSGGTTPVGTVPVHQVTKRRWMMAGGALAVAVVVAVVAVLAAAPGRTTVALNPEHVVVAVLRNATGDPSLDQVGERAGHWITEGLQQAAIPVIPWDMAQQSSEFVDAEIESGRVRDRIRALGEETGAGTVVSGAVYRIAGDSIEVRANVTDAVHGTPLGTIEPVRGARGSESDVIVEVQRRMMAFLAITLVEGEGFLMDRFTSATLPSLEAFLAFKEANRLYRQGEEEAAVRYLREASELSPDWAAPLNTMAIFLMNLQRPNEADSVLTLLEGLGDRLTPFERAQLQRCRARLEGDRQAWYRSVRRAAELSPASGERWNYGLVAVSIMNRPTEALDVWRTLDPERGSLRTWFAYWSRLFSVLHMVGEHEEALDAGQRACRQYPDRQGSCLRWQAVDLEFSLLVR